MNLNQIHAGEDYAWISGRGRGENYRRYGFYRLKVIRTFSQLEVGNTKETGYAEGFDIEPDTGEFKVGMDGQPRLRKVRARDIVTLWEEYEDEHDRREAIRAKQEAEYEARRQQRQREYEERRAREEAERVERERLAREAIEREERERKAKETRLLDALKSRYGIAKSEACTILVRDGQVAIYFDRASLEHELGLNGGDENARESIITG